MSEGNSGWLIPPRFHRCGTQISIEVAMAREPWDASHPHSHTLDNIRFGVGHPSAYAVQCPGFHPRARVRLVVAVNSVKCFCEVCVCL